MKKLVFMAIAVASLVSCTVDNMETGQSQQNLDYTITDNTNLGTYKGVFTTHNSKFRATVHIDIPQKITLADNTETLFFSTAYLTLHTGEVYVVKATEKVELGDVISDLLFESNEVSFKLTVGNDGSDPVITEANFMSIPSEILLLKETSLGPVTPITGTYACIDCGGSPYLDSGDVQTFNMIFTAPSGDGSITLQTMLGTNVLNGIGYQDNCAVAGSETTCDLNSGDGFTTTISHLANGNPVYWTGSHTFNNQIIGADDCSEASGTWNWMSNNYGLLTGNFVSDNGCFEELYFEDFTGFKGEGFSPTPTATQLDSDIIIATGFSDGSMNYGDTEVTPSTDFTRRLSAGSVGRAGVYGFAFAGLTGVGLGVQPGGSDFTPGAFEFRIENTTGNVLNSIRISYDIFAENFNSDRANSMNFSYSTDGTTFTPLPALDFTSVEVSALTGMFPPLAPVFEAKTTTFMAAVPAGGFIYLRFTGDDVSGSGTRDEFVIDNILLEGY